MVDIVNYAEQSATIVGNDTVTPIEVSAYTVTYEDLTGAGFSAGDDVIGIWAWTQANAGSAALTTVEVLTGATFGSASALQTTTTEGDAAIAMEGGKQMLYIDRRTLVDGDDFYMSIVTGTAASEARIGNWSFLMLKLDDLTENTDFLYNENTTTEVIGTGSFTSYASVTLPAGGGDDWLVMAFQNLDVGNVTVSLTSRLTLGGTGRMQQTFEAEDVNEFYAQGLIGYLPAAAGSAVCALQDQAEAATTYQHLNSTIFALRMEAFTDHSGNIDQDVVASAVAADTFVELNTVTHTASATGDCIYFAQSIADVANDNTQPYLRVQDDGTDMMATGLFNDATSARDATDELGPMAFGVASVASGSNTIDCDGADRNGHTYNFDEHTLVIFSADLAAGAPASNPKGPLGHPLKGPFGGPV